MNMSPIFFVVFGICLCSSMGVPVDPVDIFTAFTQGSPLRYVVNLTNCDFIPPYQRWLNDSFLSDVISDAILYSSSDGTWDISLATKKYIAGKRYNMTTSVQRYISVPMGNDGEAYVYVDDIDPKTWKHLGSQMIMCFTGQTKSEIAFVTTNQTKTPLFAYDDVTSAIVSGGEVTYSLNVYGKSPDNEFYYVIGRLNDYSFVDGDLTFDTELAGYDETTIYRTHLSRDNSVSVMSFSIDMKSGNTTFLKPYNGSIERTGFYRFYRLD